jgi:hypothetical protein
MTRRIVLLVAAGGAVLALLGFRNLNRIALAVARPAAPFDLAALPPAPDYADPARWSALPGREDAADAAVATLAAAQSPTADVFYIHPTS